MGEPLSRVEAILQNILGADNILVPPGSQVEEILQAIYYNTEYEKKPESRVAEILLAIKNKGVYDGPVLSRVEDILVHKLNNIPYTKHKKEDLSRVEQLLLDWLEQGGGEEVIEYTGTFPMTILANGEPLLDYLISGNTVQSGTPTPDTPVMPQGTGERTGNLWSNRGFSATAITSNYSHIISNNYGTTLSTTEGDEVTITQSAYPTGTVGYQNGFFVIDVDFSKYAVGDVVTISFDYIVNEIHALSTQTATIVYAGKNSNAVPATLSSGDWKISGRITAVITIIANMNPYVEVRLCGNSITVKNIMLNEGSTALPYEPYGYKIPISSASTTTPVYLGEVQTTRKIKKLVLDGTESWRLWDMPSGSSTQRFYINISGIKSYLSLCSHFVRMDGNEDVPHFRFGGGSYNELIFFISNSINTVADFKSYLAAQYAAGTPVTVWYVLAEPETAVVNEPLMKISNYADTLSMEQAGEDVPTNKKPTETVIDVSTSVKPSEGYIKYTEPT